MKYLFVTCILALSIGCAGFQLPVKTAPEYGPETLISTLSAIQDTAIAKEAAKEIPTASARIIITFVVESLKTTKTVTNEATYKGLIDTNLTQVRMDLPVVDELKFKSSFDFLHKILTQR
jgi:hypothetical protein